MKRNAMTVLVLVLGLLGCSPSPDRAAPQSPPILRLAVTTSTRDSGLLDVLIPTFEAQYNARVDVIAAGTGAALKLGEAGDVDVVLVHARDAEDAFMSAAHGVRREDVMYNTFLLVGPQSDPASIRGLDPVAALNAIAAAKQRFVSRGDDSGTHKRELKLWSSSGHPRPEWQEYIESGQGMGATLTMADQLGAYLLTDRGTYLKFREKITLVPLVTSGRELLNPYGIMVVNPEKHPAIHGRLAQAYVDFMVSAKAQEMIRDYRIQGESLYNPLRLSQQE